MRRLLAPFLFLLVAMPALAQTAGFGVADKQPITLDVASIEVDDQYVPPMRDPHVEHVIPVSPAEAVRLWTQDRLRAGGSQGTARVVIRNASVMEEPLERTGGIRGWFTKDQSERYTGRLQVEIVVENGGFQGTATTNVARSTTVPEDVSLAEREKVMLELVRNLARDLDSQLEPAIRQHLFPVLIL
ncbi:hypothetical protein [Indioceanicola profundi]|uniref:hypothetical protein n=1 Tax=Indioceanicola profundi TaxID=2220096 RepID=UPI000E6A9F97|nr:hypothetical protein [Indioceanicola profundi]